MKKWMQAGQACWLALSLLAGTGLGLWASSPWNSQVRGEAAQAAFSWMETEEHVILPEETEENLFWVETAQPEDGFSMEVIGRETASPPLRALIYHTHTYEAYAQEEASPYKETEKWRTADERYNMVRVGEELAGLLRGLGMEVTHDTTAFEPPDLSGSYARSLQMLEERREAGESYDLYIDLHRDAYAASQTGPNTVQVGQQKLARLMVLIGKGEGQTGQGFDEKPNWPENLKLAQAVTDSLNAQAPGLCRDVRMKNGRFNQHISTGCILIEAGNNYNTLQEVLNAMPYLADALMEALQP